MNRRLRYFVFSLLVFLTLTSSLFGQPEGYVEVKHLHSPSSDQLGCFNGSGVFDAEMLRSVIAKNDASAYQRECADPTKGMGIDLAKQTLVRYSVGSDCHMRVVTKVIRSDTEKKYKLVINNIYGGCRASGWRQGWVAFEKMPPGYVFEFAEVKVDRVHGPIRETDFAWPKPPSIKTREPLTVSEIDLKDCLPAAGQSQSILQTPKHLEDAIARDESTKIRCTQHLKSLNIDFEKQTLVGYGFASGHCARPPQLSFELVKEISSDPAENRYILSAIYADAGEKYCKVWTAYQVWVLVPKLPIGFGFDLEAKAK